MSAPLEVGVLFFPGVEELDAVGPWEVLRTWEGLGRRPVRVRSVSPGSRSLRCAHGLRVEVDDTLADVDRLDLLVHPGGPGADVLADDAGHVARMVDLASQGTLMTSVCTGTQVLAAAGLLDGLTATSHWAAREALRTRFPAVHVVEDVRWVDAGRVVTSAGVSAGLDMALHLVHRLDGLDAAEQVARVMEYAWRPEP